MDRYTKAVLTVIAVCLVIQTAKDIAFIKPAYANQIHRVAICREDGSLCAGIRDLHVGLNHGGEFPVDE